MSSPEQIAPAEEAAWAEVLSAWDDEARHLAYLARFSDLDGLALAGRRYREVLAVRPGDPLAARFRDEILKRAVVHGLSSVPRIQPAPGRNPVLVRALVVAMAAAMGGAALWVVHRLGTLRGASP